MVLKVSAVLDLDAPEVTAVAREQRHRLLGCADNTKPAGYVAATLRARVRSDAVWTCDSHSAERAESKS